MTQGDPLSIVKYGIYIAIFPLINSLTDHRKYTKTGTQMTYLVL